MIRHPKLLLSTTGGDVTAYGGLTVAAALVRGLGLPQVLDEHVELLQQHRPFHESDHILAQAYNAFVGGTCIEDLAELQDNEAVCRMLGACRLPDPTTSGDFLRRFDRRSLNHFDRALDEGQRRVWKRRWRRRRQDQAVVDLDSHMKHVVGEQKLGADFTYKGGFGYHPLIISLAHTQEVLRIINRPGNEQSAEGIAKPLDEVLDLVGERFRRVIVRGDSAFYTGDVIETCEAQDQYYALVVRNYQGLVNKADEEVPSSAWKPFRTRASRHRKRVSRGRRRRRRQNHRRRKALRRGKHDLQLTKQWLAEIPYETRDGFLCRLIIRRQRIEERNGQSDMFETYRYRFVVTNLPAARYDAQDVVDLTYQRCDQENVIEQLQNGVPAMRMPTGSLLANEAFAKCAQLAHNLKCWLAQLVLPTEVTRWKWKRFRHALVYVAAVVVKKARQVHVRLGLSHRHHHWLLAAYERLRP